MLETMTRTALDAVMSPPLVPGRRPIDLVHLSRMTLGDRALERDVLALFDRQMDMLMQRIEGAPAPIAAAAAHTMKGSAQGVGAFELATAADLVEQGARSCDATGHDDRIITLRAAIRDVRNEIAGLLSPA
jgi:HPt (histidine-containing phosphotransfer) domain-containing protein